MTLENLLQIGKLKPHEPTHEELARLLAAAGRNLKDAGHAGISPESRFDIAYKAVMQCALLAMLAQGFRPSTSDPVITPWLSKACPRPWTSRSRTCWSSISFARKETSVTTPGKASAKRRPKPARGLLVNFSMRWTRFSRRGSLRFDSKKYCGTGGVKDHLSLRMIGAGCAKAVLITAQHGLHAIAGLWRAHRDCFAALAMAASLLFSPLAIRPRFFLASLRGAQRRGNLHGRRSVAT
jgi:hypothetical protein